MVLNRWNREHTQRLQGLLDQLVYRSHLLGADRSVVNWGGGNTSVKTRGTDFRGLPIEVIWVTVDGADLATVRTSDFTALNIEDVRLLLKRESMSDEEVMDYLSHCMLDAEQTHLSIETLFHAFLPFPHVDHTHPDAIVSICCTENGQRSAEEIYGDRFVWVPYVRPGFLLAKMIAEGVSRNPRAELVLMEKHGLVTWGETAEACYTKLISLIGQAEDYIQARVHPGRKFGGIKHKTLPPEERRAVLSAVLPIIRGAVSEEQRMILTYDDTDDILTFVNSHAARYLSQIGPACPDQLTHTKGVPLYINWDPDSHDMAVLTEQLRSSIASFKATYRDYFVRNMREGDTMADPAPRVILIPGIGMVNTGRSWMLSRASGALYHKVIAVMHGSTALGTFTAINEQESYDIEYWPLALSTLSLQPQEVEFSRQIGFVTGGASGIGRASCQRFAAEGMHVVVADINVEGAQRVAEAINQQFGEGRALAIKVDVTDEQAVIEGFRQTVLAYGGVDIIINNAGLATSNPLDETTMQEWNLDMSVLATGYFLVAREAFKLLKQQGRGGSIVFIGSKNSIFAGSNVAAYSTAKAAGLQLARCVAVEGGPYGVRVNSVLPDAVMQGTMIGKSSFRTQRATTYGIKPEELEEYYRKRTTLQVNILPSDVAEAVAFLASSKASKTTGCIITVDGGVPAAFTR